MGHFLFGLALGLLIEPIAVAVWIVSMGDINIDHDFVVPDWLYWRRDDDK